LGMILVNLIWPATKVLVAGRAQSAAHQRAHRKRQGTEVARAQGRKSQQLWRNRHRGEWEADLRERADAWAKAHPESRRAKNGRWRAENPDKVRDYNRRYNYGITPAQYAAMVTVQSNKCAICEGPPRGKPFLLVDHDHETGRVRGLLCQPCNVGLGHLEDSAVRLRAAAAYLEDYGSVEAVGCSALSTDSSSTKSPT
jgi:hypothetical protein